MKNVFFLIPIAILLISCALRKTKEDTEAVTPMKTSEVEASQHPTSEVHSTYIPDPRLHDIWALELMNGKQGTALNFNRSETPVIEIDTRTQHFLGSAGCNRITGRLLFEKDILRFADVASTRMACPDLEAEAEFLNTLQGVTSYTVKDLKLYLSAGDSENVLVFKKID